MNRKHPIFTTVLIGLLCSGMLLSATPALAATSVAVQEEPALPTEETPPASEEVIQEVVPPEAEMVTLSATTLSVTVGQTATMIATVSPTDATDKTVTYKSSDTKVATVSAQGVVTGKKPGTATITAATANGKTATCKVTVQPIVATGITLSQASATVEIGKTVTLKATVSPADTTDKTVAYKSSDTKVAAVSAQGVVTGKKPGTATITAATANGKTATCKVTVPFAPVTSLKAAAQSINSVKLTWKSVAEATSYTLYRSDSKTGTYSKVTTLSGNTSSYVQKNLTPGKVYYYKLVTNGSTTALKSKDSALVSAKGQLSAPTGCKVTKGAVNTLTISWKKVASAKGYAVYYSTSKNGTYKKLASVKSSATSYTHKNCKAGTTYYYKVYATYSPTSANSVASGVVSGKAYPQINVPYLNQNAYPTGCEAASATMVLRFYGVNTTIANTIRKMPKGNLYYSGGRLYGPHPDNAFIGSPNSYSGYGCYAGTVVTTMNRLLPQGKTAVKLKGKSLSFLTTYLDKGQPVLLWATMNMAASYPTTSWRVQGTNNRYTWIANEHCLVLTGYDKNYYYFNDPYLNHGRIRYRKSLVEKRYKELGSQAVVVNTTATKTAATTTKTTTTAKTTSTAKKETLLSYKTTTAVNYRQKASTSGKVQGTLKKGEKVQVVSDYSSKAGGYTWYKIKKGNSYYYVASNYLQKVATTTKTTSTAKKETLLSYKTTTAVNYRQKASISGKVQGTLKKGEKVQVVSGSSSKAGGYTWYKIKKGSSYYYVASKYLKKA